MIGAYHGITTLHGIIENKKLIRFCTPFIINNGTKSVEKIEAWILKGNDKMYKIKIDNMKPIEVPFTSIRQIEEMEAVPTDVS